MTEVLSQPVLQALESAAAEEKDMILREALSALREGRLDGPAAIAFWCRIDALDSVATRLAKAGRRARIQNRASQDS